MQHEIDLRAMFPDVARAGDATAIVLALRHRGLLVQRKAGAITITLQNDYRLVLMPAETGTDGQPAWAITGHRVPEPEHGRPRNHVEAFIAAMAQRQRDLPEEFPLYCMNAHLEGGFDGTVPARTWYIESPSLIEICDGALTWARRTSGLPLQFKRRSSWRGPTND